MRPRIAIGMLGLALAGCAHSRSASPVASRPVGMDPVPSIHDTINRGMGDPALQKATLADTRHPKWSGKFVPPGNPQAATAAAGAPTGLGPDATNPSGLAANRPGTSAVLASPSSTPDGAAHAPPMSIAAPIAAASPLMTQPAAAPVQPGPVAPPSAPEAPAGELPDVEEPKGGSPAAALPPVSAPMSAAPEFAGSTPAASGPAAKPSAGDPLLGPNPELMPAIDGPIKPPAAAAKPTGVPAETAPAPTPAPAAAPVELPLEGAPLPPVDPQPAQGSLPAPAASPAPAPAHAGGGTAALDRTPATSSARAGRRADPGVKLASYNNAMSLEQAIDREWREAGRSAARVGDDVITLHDLVLNVKEQLQRNPPGRSLNREELNMVAKSVLAGLIERTMIVQEAKRTLKNPKQIQRLQEAADKYWREEELPPMMRKYSVETEYQLSQKLKESGRSLESLRQAYHQEFVAQVFLEQKFADRRKVELPEMLAYYQKHLHDKEFDRPAVITWRELVVEKGRHPAPGEAQRKADALLARLSRGDDFATLARTESEGPSRVRQDGGLMQTSPGSYVVEAVNQALAGLPLGQLSPVLEGPTSFHIVRVEARRAAGPATFEEIQDQIRRRLLVEKLRKARMDFLAKLRRDTLVSTIFDGTDSDPNRPQDD